MFDFILIFTRTMGPRQYKNNNKLGNYLNHTQCGTFLHDAIEKCHSSEGIPLASQ
jgi:hypothetical protein